MMPERLNSLWRDWRGFVLFIAVMLLFRSAIADWNHVPTGSMKPAILEGDRIVVDKLAYDLRIPFTLHRIASWDEPGRGDVVTFPSPLDDRLYVKRVLGLPGDVVELRDNHLVINGVPAHYQELSREELAGIEIPDKARYLFFRESFDTPGWIVMLERRSGIAARRNFGPVTVPADRYLVLGDNRDESGDFRVIGWVARERILGRANVIAFSLDYDNYFAPRLHRFFEPLP